MLLCKTAECLLIEDKFTLHQTRVFPPKSPQTAHNDFSVPEDRGIIVSNTQIFESRKSKGFDKSWGGTYISHGSDPHISSLEVTIVVTRSMRQCDTRDQNVLVILSKILPATPCIIRYSWWKMTSQRIHPKIYCGGSSGSEFQNSLLNGCGYF